MVFGRELQPSNVCNYEHQLESRPKNKSSSMHTDASIIVLIDLFSLIVLVWKGEGRNIKSTRGPTEYVTGYHWL
jgi:hypothetical protein